jgi:hypothetical protein
MDEQQYKFVIIENGMDDVYEFAKTYEEAVVAAKQHNLNLLDDGLDFEFETSIFKLVGVVTSTRSEVEHTITSEPSNHGMTTVEENK